MARTPSLAVSLLVLGCSSSGARGFADVDASSDPNDDAGAPVRDAGREADSSACTLGTADACGTCATKCPGVDDAHTQRTCSDATAAGTCGLTCKGEFYDLNGVADDGCEAEDSPAQDTEATAVAINLPDVDAEAQGNPHNLTSQVYGDGRAHDAAPASRPLGRDDLYKVTAVGNGQASTGMTACLTIVGFPADDTFEVCISGDGQNTFPAASCKSVTPASQGSAPCVSPPGTNPNAGTFLVRVRKTAGTNTPNKYALYLTH